VLTGILISSFKSLPAAPVIDFGSSGGGVIKHLVERKHPEEGGDEKHVSW